MTQAIRFTIDRAKRFVANFAKAFHPNAELCFFVHNTSKRNVFDLCLVMPRHEKFMITATYGSMSGYAIHVSIDPLFQQVYPKLMLRPNQYVTMKDLIETYGLDEKSIVQKITTAVKIAYNKSPKLNSFSASQCAPYSFSDSDDKTITLKETHSFEELVVMVDLA